MGCFAAWVSSNTVSLSHSARVCQLWPARFPTPSYDRLLAHLLPPGGVGHAMDDAADASRHLYGLAPMPSAERVQLWDQLASRIPPQRLNCLMDTFIHLDMAGIGAIPTPWVPEFARMVGWQPLQSGWLDHEGFDCVVPEGYTSYESILWTEIMAAAGPQAQAYTARDWPSGGAWIFEDLIITSEGPGVVTVRTEVAGYGLAGHGDAEVRGTLVWTLLRTLLPDITILALSIPGLRVDNSLLCLHHLRYLNLERCQLTVLPSAVGCLPSLRYFNASENRLAGLPDTMAHARSLRQLYLGDNQLTDCRVCRNLPLTDFVADRNLISDGEFASLRSPLLLQYSLKGALLSQIPVDRHFPKLQQLCLPSNRISTLHMLLPAATPVLVHLNLEWNQIQHFPETATRWSRLEVLRMEGNPAEIRTTSTEDGEPRWPFLRQVTMSLGEVAWSSWCLSGAGVRLGRA